MRHPRLGWRDIALLAYVALLLYGSLYPFARWRATEESFWSLFFEPGRVSRTDLLANLLLYVPLGWLLARSSAAGSSLRAYSIAALGGALVSLAVEYAQAFIPGRVSSIYDWALNVAGSVLGAWLSAFTWSRRFGSALDRVVEPSATSKAAVIAVVIWVGAQLFPFVPSPDIGNLRAGLRPIAAVLRGSAPFSASQAVGYALAVFALCIVLESALRKRYRRVAFVGLFFSCVLVSKVPILTRQLSLEALLGAGLAFVAYPLLRNLHARFALAGSSIVGYVIVEQLRSAGGAATSAFNWVPFRGHLTNELIGVTDILENSWPFLALAFLFLRLQPARPIRLAVGGTLTVLVVMAGLEWVQKYIPGRSPDVTDAVIAAVAFLLPFIYSRHLIGS